VPSHRPSQPGVVLSAHHISLLPFRRDSPFPVRPPSPPCLSLQTMCAANMQRQCCVTPTRDSHSLCDISLLHAARSRTRRSRPRTSRPPSRGATRMVSTTAPCRATSTSRNTVDRESLPPTPYSIAQLPPSSRRPLTHLTTRVRMCRCWAHGSVSALGDRVKIARGGKGIDINLAVQHILNCANVGSCHGGSVDGPYQWLHSVSQSTGTGISYETSQPYMACSSESTEGLCTAGKWDCSAENVARTCSTFPPEGKCVGLSSYPNVTISGEHPSPLLTHPLCCPPPPPSHSLHLCISLSLYARGTHSTLIHSNHLPLQNSARSLARTPCRRRS
jgi:hypothetical protein